MTGLQRDDVQELLAATGSPRPAGAPPILALVDVLRRNLVVFVVALVVGLAGGFLWYATTPVTYTAHAVSRAGLAPAGSDGRSQRALASFVSVFANAATVNAALKDLGPRAAGVTVGDVMSNLSATPVPAANSIDLALVCLAPEVGAAIVNAVAHRASETASTTLGRDGTELEARLSEALAGERAALNEVTTRAVKRRSALRVESLLSETAALSAANATLVTMQANIAAKRAQLKALSAARAAATSPDGIARIEAQVAAASGELSGLEANRQEMVGVLRIPKAEANKLATLYSAQAEIKELDAEVQVAQNSYQAVATRYRAFVAEQQVTRPSFVVTEEALLPLSPNSRMGFLKLLVALSLAMIVAGFAVAFREASRNGRAAA